MSFNIANGKISEVKDRCQKAIADSIKEQLGRVVVQCADILKTHQKDDDFRKNEKQAMETERNEEDGTLNPTNAMAKLIEFLEPFVTAMNE